jgi:hypothetical protein
MANKTNKSEDKLPRTVSIFPYQTGRVKNIFADMSRYAMEPGKRISITGRVYWETRKNRSDVTGKNV